MGSRCCFVTSFHCAIVLGWLSGEVPLSAADLVATGMHSDTAVMFAGIGSLLHLLKE